MKTLPFLRRQRALLNCAPITQDRFADRSMRSAVSRANRSDEFVNQQNFDRAVAALVRLVPIPPESAEWFPDKDAIRIAQIWLVEKRIQLFLFPAERNTKTGAVLRFPGWRYVYQEGWTGAVTEHSGVCFMAALRGGEKDLAPYIANAKE